jgi:hypothetical protein
MPNEPLVIESAMVVTIFDTLGGSPVDMRSLTKRSIFTVDKKIGFFSLALSKMMARPRPWKKRHRHFEVEVNNSDLGGSNNSSPGLFLRFSDSSKNSMLVFVCLCE